MKRNTFIPNTIKFFRYNLDWEENFDLRELIFNFKDVFIKLQSPVYLFEWLSQNSKRQKFTAMTKYTDMSNVSEF